MGGNALSVPSVRLSKEEYRVLTRKIDGALRNRWNGTIQMPAIVLVPSYLSKESFGDADFVVCMNHCPEAGVTKEEFAKVIKATEVSHNGNVMSCGVNTPNGIFQIDFIFCKPECFEYSLKYFSYNDVSNLIGRTARNLSYNRKYATKGHYGGFKHGHDGLWYILRDAECDTRVIEEILVTLDFDRAVEFLGYKSGFHPETKEDIFEYAISSPFASFDIFDLRNRNHAARTRDSKRVIYTEFVDWLEKNPEKNNPVVAEGMHDFKLQEAFSIFDGFKTRYDAALDRHSNTKIIKTKFNGQLVAELTGLVGNDLGKFIESFKKTFADIEDFRNWVLNSRQDFINRKIKTYYEKNI